ncbi:MAG: 2-phospho-L-lactate transferase [Methanobacteriaceae archaeon]
MISVLSGGTGTPKLLQGIKEIYDNSKINVIVNTVENDYFSGVYVAPDVDTVLYTLADIINTETWYGIKDDSFISHEMLNELGCPELLKIGDKDRGFKIQKTLLLKNKVLSEVLEIQRKSLAIKSKIIPMSNEDSEIEIISDIGNLKFHDYLIKKQCKPNVKGISYNNVPPAPDLIETIENSDKVIIGPSNPITSIGPILAIEGVEKALKNSYVIAVSPIIGNSAFSGPAGIFMKALNYEVSPLGVSKIYSNFLDKFIIDEVDFKLKNNIENIIKDVVVYKTKMENIEDKKALAKIVLA